MNNQNFTYKGKMIFFFETGLEFPRMFFDCSHQFNKDYSFFDLSDFKHGKIKIFNKLEIVYDGMINFNYKKNDGFNFFPDEINQDDYKWYHVSELCFELEIDNSFIPSFIPCNALDDILINVNGKLIKVSYLNQQDNYNIFVSEGKIWQISK